MQEDIEVVAEDAESCTTNDKSASAVAGIREGEEELERYRANIERV